MAEEKIPVQVMLPFSWKGMQARYDIHGLPCGEFGWISPPTVTPQRWPDAALTAVLPDHWAAAHPEDMIVHRMEYTRHLTSRNCDDRQKRRETLAAAFCLQWKCGTFRKRK